MKIKNRIEKKYFDWIYNMMCAERFADNISYKKLFTYLHSIDFKYLISQDSNRAEDGIDLRYKFVYHEDILDSEKYLTGPCSVLEMIVALAIKWERLTTDVDYSDRTSQWFWCMINNLGLGSMYDTRFDEKLVSEYVQKFLNRTYEPNGRGGLFTIRNCKYDLRNVEIWYQLNWYLDTFM